MASNLEELACGMHEQCDLKVPSEPPEWLDKDKYLRGRKFFMENALSVFMSNFRNLVIGLSVPNLWYGAQSFTSLMADLRQDINRVSSI